MIHETGFGVAPSPRTVGLAIPILVLCRARSRSLADAQGACLNTSKHLHQPPGPGGLRALQPFAAVAPAAAAYASTLADLDPGRAVAVRVSVSFHRGRA